VTGIDFAQPAIATAEAAHPDVRGLRFEVVDICRRAPDEGRFGVMLDRGCLHTVPAGLRPDYVRNAAAAAVPGARFLLLFRVGPETTKDATVRALESLCGVAFEVVRVTDAVLAGDGDASRDQHRGVALWMTCR